MSTPIAPGEPRLSTDDPDFQAAVAAINEGRLNDVARLCGGVIARDASFGPAHHIFGVAALQAGDFFQARDALERALALLPGNGGVQCDLAATYLGFGRIAEAKRLLDGLPAELRDNINVVMLLAQVFALADDKSQAHEAYQRANEMHPFEPSILEPLSDLVTVLQDADSGEKLFEDAIRAAGPRPDLLAALGQYQLKAGNLDGAIETFRKILTDAPSDAAIRDGAPPDAAATVGLFRAYQMACRWEQAAVLEKPLDELIAKAASANASPKELPLNYVGRSMNPAGALRVAALRSAAVATDSSRLPRLQTLPRRDGRLTIGYLSSDFRDHAVAHLCGGMFPAHDRDRHRIIGYSLDSDSGVYGRAIADACDKFVDLRCVGNTLVAARMIRDDGVDILVDLNGWTTGARPHILAHGPAPIQVNYLGYPGSCGSSFHDYIIVDRIICPEEDAPHYSEAFAYLPHSYQINDDRQAIDSDHRTRTELGLPEDAFVLACLNRPEKIDQASFLSWMRIMERVPESVLWLATATGLSMRTLREAAQFHGVSGDRMIFAPRAPKPQHLARLRQIDLGLDTRIYNGHTTTSDALWAGVPVITVTGTHFASRVSSSLLHAVGLGELACPDMASFEALAIDLARDPARLARLRRVLETPAETPLFRTADTVRALESLYGRMADRHDRGESPAMISA